MPKVLRTHISQRIDIKGVEGSDLITLDSFIGVNDPLSGDNTVVNKPGASIPSMFARMIFFKTAFASITNNNIDGTSVYHQLVSQCLDLLERVFNDASGLKIIKYDIAQQIDVLARDGMTGHANFSKILKEQTTKFLPNIAHIFLFEDGSGKVIGGTSPYTLVYTSPTWNSGNGIRSLLQRDRQFRRYLYSMRKAYQGIGHIGNQNTVNNSFFNYIGFCEQRDDVHPDNNYTTDRYLNEYEHIQTSNNVDVYVDTQILLGKNPPQAFTSDFFISPTQAGYRFDVKNTPIVLSPGNHPGLKYYGNNLWKSQFQVDDISNAPLPGGCPPHPSVRSVDFFENDMLALPYPIDETKYGISIPITDGSDGVLYSALLPLKPKFLEFFRPEDIKQMLTITPSDSAIKLKLSIPIRNAAGDQKGRIDLVKDYSRADNIHYVFKRNLQNGFNIGISPLVKSANQNLNDYWVMTSLDSPSSISDVKLDFYKFAQSTPLAMRPGYPIQRAGLTGNSAKTWYTNIGVFDYINVRFTKNDSATGKVTIFGALVIPNFICPVEGNDKYYYGVDFGTTNTHIAFTSGNNVRPISFNSDTFQSQVAYLNKLTYTRGGTEFEMEDRLRVVKAREFYPNAQSNQYDFPIRTALYAELPVNQNTSVYAGASIGFHYPKEFTLIPSYFTSLKWDFLKVGSSDSRGRVGVFFKEILLMIKNHWLSQSNVDHNVTPSIMITFPLNSANPKDNWVRAYCDVFRCDEHIADLMIDTQEESLAPCVSMIMKGAVTANGLLNIDIGGGTTDIQYYRVVDPAQPQSFYDSIRFAGDDLWGTSFENMPNVNVISIFDNNFTRLAHESLDSNLQISIGRNGADKTPFGNIQLQGKELINCLLRDQGHAFSNLLSTINTNTNICRLQMFLHYSAIIYHIFKKIEKQQLAIPAIINFSGMGSKYLELLFPQHSMQYLTNFTKQLLKVFLPGVVIPQTFEVKLSSSPKNVTAEGAALTFYTKTTTPKTVPDTPLKFSPLVSLNYNDLMNSSTTSTVVDDLRNFLDCYRNVDLTSLNQEKPFIPQMQDDVYNHLIQMGEGSYLQIATSEAQCALDRNKMVNDAPLFIWTLKDSLWKI